MPRKGECMDLTGQKFGRWTVIERSIPRYNKRVELRECGDAYVTVALKE